MASGSWTSRSAATTRWVRYAPSGRIYATRSPTLKSVTASPISATTPAASAPGISGVDGQGYRPLRKYVSMKLTPIARCTMRTSPRPGLAVSSAVHSSASGPPAVRTTTPMSVICSAIPTSLRSRQGLDEAPYADDGLAQPPLVGGEAYPHETARLLAERAAVEHRHALGSIQSAHEIVARKSRAPHIHQHEHAGVGTVALEPADALESCKQKTAPGSAIFPNAGFRGIRNAQCRDGRLLHEPRKSEQHALRHRLRMNHHLRRTHQPAGPPARHGMRLGQ